MLLESLDYKSITILNHLNPCPNQYCEETEKYRIFSLSITDPIPSYLNISLECFNEPDEEFIKSWLWQSEDMATLELEKVNISLAIIGGFIGGILLILPCLIHLILQIKAKKCERLLMNDLHGDAGGNGNNGDNPSAIREVIYEEIGVQIHVGNNHALEHQTPSAEEPACSVSTSTGPNPDVEALYATVNKAPSTENPACSVSTFGPNPDVEALYATVNKVRSNKAKKSADQVGKPHKKFIT